MTPDVLVINSYAGSLTIAATQLGLDVRGSYEDAGYVLPVQRLNFPHLRYKEKTAYWPAEDLSSTVVIAHPPCAAFSSQNTSPEARGLNTAAFKCTVQVMRYAFQNRCMALLVESVPQALAGAAELHSAMAKEYRYDVFKVLQNALTFGLPQWRPRFWCVFVPEGQLEYLSLRHEPRFKAIGQVMTEADPGPADPDLERRLNLQLEKFRSLGLTAETIESLINPSDGTAGYLFAVCRKVLGLHDKEEQEVRKEYCYDNKGFMTHGIRILNPAGFTSTLLWDSFWVCLGRVVSYEEYKAAMGFPRSYKFPDYKKLREFLSKGVCPPVAKWILKETIDNLAGKVRLADGSQVIAPGEIADFNLKKGDFKL